MIPLHAELSGEFTVTVGKLGQKPRLAHKFKNLITNAGLDRIATNTDHLAYCQVGSGSTTPAFTDTALAARVAGVTRTTTPTYYNLYVDPDDSTKLIASVSTSFQFAPGTATGNLSEIGVGWGTTGSLFSRALIVNSSGVPTTITVLPDEYLNVTYYLRKRLTAPSDVVTTATIGGVSYTITVRPAYLVASDVNGGYCWSYPLYAQSMAFTTILNYRMANLYTGGIGATTDRPSGTTLDNTEPTVSNSTYVAGSYTRTGTFTWGLTTGNGNIRSATIPSGVGLYQVQFDPAITKTSSTILTLTFSMTWGRA